MASRENWGSRIGFILAAAGSAIGLGNIWRFPFKAQENGGAIFLVVYLLAVVMLGLPVMVAEISLGRQTGKNPVGAFKEIKPKGPWKLAGYLGVLTGIMILSYYSVVAGWTLGYLGKTAFGTLKNVDTATAPNIFAAFINNVWLQIFLLAAFIFLTVYIVSKGVGSGIEKFSKILMPGLFIILVVLVVRSVTLPGAMKGLEFYLKPDFSKLGIKVVTDALGQAFFSLSLGMGAMITYGSYLKKKESIPVSSVWVVFLDTFVAVMAGFMIFPALSAYGFESAGGPGLVFNILPVIFTRMPLGIFFGVLFFILLSIAALTSTVSLLEVATAYCVDEARWSRKKSVWLVGLISFLIGVPSALSFANIPFLQDLPLVHGSFFELMDFLWGNLGLTIGALFICLFVAWVWKTDRAIKEIKREGRVFKLAPVWSFWIKFICPLLIVAILVALIIDKL